MVSGDKNDGIPPAPTTNAPPHAAGNVFSSLTPGDSAYFPFKRFFALIGGVGVLVVAMIVYSAETGLRMFQRYSPLIDAAMEIKLEATTGHLWFEEVVRGGRIATIEEAHAHLDQADWYARAMLEGGQNAEGVFVPLHDLELRAQIAEVRVLLSEFKTQMADRWRNRNVSAHAPQMHISFDRTFRTFIEKADQVETRLQNLASAAERRFIVIQVILMLVTLSVTAFLVFLFMRFAKLQNRSMTVLTEEIEQRERIELTLREQATTDTLTGLLNRRSISDRLQDELHRSQRLDTPFSIVIFDIDHFKRVNDTYGHEVGDNVLIAVATTVKARLRELDALARWGGEEFLILLPATALDGAVALAEICRERLANTPIEGVTPVTASFGVAAHRGGENIRELIHRADIALYEAKGGGRNRVEASVT